MITLYIDNFRGFNDTYIPIKDVNFFVGENSTGKTSLLSVLFLLGSPSFWIEQEFNNFELQLGTFQDMININSPKHYFSIGLIDCPAENESDECLNDATNKPVSFLMKFIEEDGAPIIDKYYYLGPLGEACLQFHKGTIRYSISSRQRENYTYRNVFDIFRRWTEDEEILTELLIMKNDEIAHNRYEGILDRSPGTCAPTGLRI